MESTLLNRLMEDLLIMSQDRYNILTFYEALRNKYLQPNFSRIRYEQSVETKLFNNFNDSERLIIDSDMAKQKPFESIDGNPLNRRFKGYLVINWETGELRVLKTKSAVLNRSPLEFAINYCIDIRVPEMPTHTLEHKVDLSDTDIINLFCESV